MADVLINRTNKLRGSLADIVEHQTQSLCLVHLHWTQPKTALSANCSDYLRINFCRCVPWFCHYKLKNNATVLPHAGPFYVLCLLPHLHDWLIDFSLVIYLKNRKLRWMPSIHIILYEVFPLVQTSLSSETRRLCPEIMRKGLFWQSAKL